MSYRFASQEALVKGTCRSRLRAWISSETVTRRMLFGLCSFWSTFIICQVRPNESCWMQGRSCAAPSLLPSAEIHRPGRTQGRMSGCGGSAPAQASKCLLVTFGFTYMFLWSDIAAIMSTTAGPRFERIEGPCHEPSISVGLGLGRARHARLRLLKQPGLRKSYQAHQMQQAAGASGMQQELNLFKH